MVVETTFEATCEGCGAGVELSASEQWALIGDDGSFRCGDCTTEVWRLKRRARNRRRSSSARKAGCIVTVRYRHGGVATFHEKGDVIEALRVIVERIPEGTARVMAISTPASILRDLDGDRPDPYAVERTLLGRVGRMDLLG